MDRDRRQRNLIPILWRFLCGFPWRRRGGGHLTVRFAPTIAADHVGIDIGVVVGPLGSNGFGGRFG
jgi:hypothetical protein